MFASGSAASGWFSILAIAGALVAGIVLRRFKRAPAVVRRMRPHYLLGYAALGFALVHVMFAMGMMRETGSTGIQFATVGLIALGLQTFIGASLQDPGGYRGALRAWHYAMIAILFVALLVHVTVNGALLL